jgi:hypothetical protein
MGRLHVWPNETKIICYSYYPYSFFFSFFFIRLSILFFRQVNSQNPIYIVSFYQESMYSDCI